MALRRHMDFQIARYEKSEDGQERAAHWENLRLDQEIDGNCFGPKNDLSNRANVVPGRDGERHQIGGNRSGRQVAPFAGGSRHGLVLADAAHSVALFVWTFYPSILSERIECTTRLRSTGTLFR